jgi:hypothetical protein
MIAALCLACSSARAEGWGWNPFAKKEATTRKTSARSDGFGGSRPKLGTARPKVSGEPNLFQRMGESTMNLFGGGSKTKKSSRPTGWSGSSARNSDAEKSSWLSWFRREEPRPSQTIEGFLKQPRPED